MPQATAQELVSLADALRDASDAIDDKVKSTMDPFSPEGQHLRDISAHITLLAGKIGSMALAMLVPGVGPAVDHLTNQVKIAKGTLDAINGVQKALSLAAAVLSIAASVASRDPLGTIEGVGSLVTLLQNATAAANA